MKPFKNTNYAFEHLEVNICAYCGVVADTVDHLVPKHLLERAEMAMIDLSAVYRMKNWELPACRECNSAISGQLFKTLKERRECAHNHIRRKYKSALNMPNWTEEEIEEMGPNMQREIRRGLQLRHATRERLAFNGCAKYAIDISSLYDLFKNTAA